MSKERARRREARKREAAIVTAARAAEAERRERRRTMQRAMSRRLPRRHSRQTGVLAQRRRKQAGTTIALVIALNVMVWVFFPGWATQGLALVVTLLAAPVLHTLLFRR
jgi:Flp pilus assembly protein TadB